MCVGWMKTLSAIESVFITTHRIQHRVT